MTARRPAVGVAVLLAAMVVLDLVRGESVPGSWAAFGFVTCAAWIVVTKWLGARWLWRDAAGDEGVDVAGRGDG